MTHHKRTESFTDLEVLVISSKKDRMYEEAQASALDAVVSEFQEMLIEENKKTPDMLDFQALLEVCIQLGVVFPRALEIVRELREMAVLPCLKDAEPEEVSLVSGSIHLN